MKDTIRRLNAEFGFELTEEEIEIIAGQAELMKRLFEPLYEIDTATLPPALKLDIKAK